MAVIYHVEHGDTKYDEQDKAQGLIDSGLTERGKRQARGAGRALQHTTIDCVYASPMKRAQETAHIIADCLGAKVITLPRLKPLDIGTLAGKPNSTVKGYLEFFSRRPTLSLPKGETFGEYYDRVRKEWIHQFKDDDPEIAVVCHARDWQLLKHWQKNGLDAEPADIIFREPNSAEVSRVTRDGNKINIRRIA